nr:unnamed protein product [Digitaria exilis]
MDATGLLPFSFLLLLAGHRAFVASDAGGFSVEFIHRDSPRSPFHNPALSPHGRMLAAARRSLRGDPSRGAPPAPSPAADVVGAGGVESKIISRSFEYLMAVNVGTPPTQILAIADTGSDLVWVNCRTNTSSDGVARGGDGGAAAGGVVFRPSSSSTYDVVGCETEACQNLNRASCDADSNCRFYALVACFKLALDCFFAVWICIVFLAFGFIGYTLPFILCTMICCCLPCIISVLGVHEDLDLNRGATTDTINALVAYKFKSRRIHDGDVEGNGGGVLAAGTDKERTILAEDAICCICLSKFSSNEDLRELPCTHVFHMECIDKWLQINALCPLCKAEIGSSKGVPETGSGRSDDNRVGNDVESQR